MTVSMSMGIGINIYIDYNSSHEHVILRDGIKKRNLKLVNVFMIYSMNDSHIINTLWQ